MLPDPFLDPFLEEMLPDSFLDPFLAEAAPAPGLRHGDPEVERLPA